MPKHNKNGSVSQEKCSLNYRLVSKRIDELFKGHIYDNDRVNIVMELDKAEAIIAEGDGHPATENLERLDQMVADIIDLISGTLKCRPVIVLDLLRKSRPYTDSI